VTLKASYTNTSIAKKLKRRILNSVLRQSKRANQLMLEWQTERDKENTVKEGEEENKTTIEESSNTRNNSTIEQHHEITTPKKDFIENPHQNESQEKEAVEDDCPLLIPADVEIKTNSNNNNNIFLLFDEKQNVTPKEEKKMKIKNTVFKKLVNGFHQTEEEKNILNLKAETNNNEALLLNKRKNVLNLDKSSTKKHKAIEEKSSRKKVTFNLSENYVNQYDLQKPITLTSNVKINNSPNTPNKGVLKNPKSKSKVKNNLTFA